MKTDDIEMGKWYLIRYKGHPAICKKTKPEQRHYPSSEWGWNSRRTPNAVLSCVYYHGTGQPLDIKLTLPLDHDYKSIILLDELGERSVSVKKIMKLYPEEFI